MQKAGKLIVIEGLDSSGKETQSRLVQKYFEDKNIPSKRIGFPNYSSNSSALVKMYLAGIFGDKADSVNPYAASSFYAVDRYATYKTDFEQFYKNGGIIIADRYTTSNIIHQACKITDTDEREKFLNWIENYEYNLIGLPKPDKVIFLNMPFEVSLNLMKNRLNKADGSSVKDIHERDTKYLYNTYNTAMEMVKKFGWLSVNCSENGNIRSIEDIHKSVIEKVDE